MELVVPEAPNAPLFSLNLGANGGTFAPTSFDEVVAWVTAEQTSWNWIFSVQGGQFRNAVHALARQLHEMTQQLEQSSRYPEGTAQRINGARSVHSKIDALYLTQGFPHRTSALGIRILEIQKRSPLEALAYMYVYVPNDQYPFDTNAAPAWRGFLAAMAERYGLANVPKEAFQAELTSVEELKAGLSSVIAGKTEAMSALHREYETLRDECRTTGEENSSRFSSILQQIEDDHGAALKEHIEAMKNLQEVFREQMALRAPVDYWDDRRHHHEKRTKILGRWTFGTMAVLAAILGGVAWWVMGNLTANGKPELWRVSVLVLVAVIGVWAVRLIVRMFLSHSHLETDAAERVVMVKTYLSLLESDKDLSPDDRKLVLAPLFRPASDGIVKDEGLPHPALEALTKLGGR